MRTPAIRRQDEAEAILTPKVPYLKIYRVLLDVQSFDYELDAQRDAAVVVKSPADISIHEVVLPTPPSPAMINLNVYRMFSYLI